MDVSLVDAALLALSMLAEPTRLMFLALGALLGLILGILPGIGGVAGTAILIPFTFGMDPYTAFAFLLGLGSTTATGDPIPAVLFGMPGGAGSAATVLDGHPMAKRGEAGRALSACYMASLMGGVFGAALMAVSIPLLRPMVLAIGSPELLALAIFGISMVAVLSGNTPLRGLAAAALGLMLSMIGPDPQTGTQRWTLDSIYLWEGLHLVPLLLGLFALPELCDLAIQRTSITAGKVDVKGGMWHGAMDCFRHWWLVLRCSWIGAFFGAVPGVGASIIDWLAYGHAARTEKGAQKSFGSGDVRGVIASESANNAKEGGALVPTVAFGVPGSAGMAVLLAAFMVHGLIPGPEMLNKNLSVTYSMVWSIALANIVGAGLCYLFSAKLALVATLRYTLVMPAVLGIVYIGAFESGRDWGDLYALLAFGLLGWVMKHLRWPRPPLILGIVLGDIFERYLFISMERYGSEWLTRPLVVLLLAVAFLGLVRPLWQDLKASRGIGGLAAGLGPPRFAPALFFPLALIALFAVMLFEARQWSSAARLVPQIVGAIGLTCAALSLGNAMFRRAGPAAADKGHMDLASDIGHLQKATVLARAAIFFAWFAGFMGAMATIGLIPTVTLFVAAYMRLENREPWKLVLGMAAGLTAFVYVVFHRLLNVPWPETLLGTWVPALKWIPSV
ncbi:MAG TPA: tripartite tricarboxylate transporter permease [Burkholderiales bacterium]|jgi:TctA family transporter|nr:tripartite tricarboxylate transporter permease [Burkholderiales bacterium]